jgi:hypothetical protein
MQAPPGGVGQRGHTVDPLRKSRAVRAWPPKEQPPWNLSGTRDRKGDDSLESRRGVARVTADGVGGFILKPRNLSGPHDRQGRDGNKPCGNAPIW